ncbi:MAG: pantoate--beta-alanine ligase [Gammaproteobacteria bacterium]
MMNILTEIKQWENIRNTLAGKSIGFVPTMGNLHVGHMSLCEKSLKENNITVVSIFINPTQFDQAEDFELYPRTLEQDILHLKNINYLMLPTFQDLYPDNYQIQISETCQSLVLEGQYRPDYFNGMLTIILKLLNIIQPTRAYFGEKDYQQLLLIQKMASALFLQTAIIGCPTVRTDDGLALSSRNSRLSSAQRKKATQFSHLLHSQLSSKEIKTTLEQQGFTVDYIEEKWGRRLGAVWLDNIRLIDNIKI